MTLGSRTLRGLSAAALLLGWLTASPALAARGITVAAVGDVMMGSDFPAPKLPADRGRRLLAPAAPIFKSCDLALANLEGPLTATGEPVKEAVPGHSYLFRTPPAYAANLKDAGISMVSLANNHSLDFGAAGLASTKRALKKAGIAFSAKTGEIAEFEVRGITVGVLSLSFGPSPRSIVHPAAALAEIEEAARRYQILILSIHAGGEGAGAQHVRPGMEYYLNEPRGDLLSFAHRAIERGASLVLAHGPHVPRALELYRGRLIACSLGNFATYGGVNVAGASGYAPLLTVALDEDGAFRSGMLHSFRQRYLSGPQPDPQQHALKLMQRLTAADFPGSGLLFGGAGEIVRTR
jgi:hypothetical protein